MAGYTKLAAFMVETNYHIFRKYQRLAVRDLLYLQAELYHLELKYTEVAGLDAAQVDDEKQHYERDWRQLKTSAERGFGGEQWALALAIRVKLREYYTALERYAQIAATRQPKAAERRILRDWILQSALGGACRFLSADLSHFGPPEPPSVYEPVYQKDLAVLLNEHGEDDLVTKFIKGPLLRFYHLCRQRSKTPLPIDPELPAVGANKSFLQFYEAKDLATATNFLGTIFSCVAPLISIVVLDFVRSDRARLGLVCTFTLLFSACLAIATTARRIEIFAATAAYVKSFYLWLDLRSQSD